MWHYTWASVYIGAPFWEHGGTLFSYGLRGKGKISFYQENFYEEFERHVKEGSGNGQLSL
jgi:hypothetical protein